MSSIFSFPSIFLFIPLLFPCCSLDCFIQCFISTVTFFLSYTFQLHTNAPCWIASVRFLVMRLSLGLRDSYFFPRVFLFHGWKSSVLILFVCVCVCVCSVVDRCIESRIFAQRGIGCELFYSLGRVKERCAQNKASKRERIYQYIV